MPDKDFPETKTKSNLGTIYFAMLLFQTILFTLIAFFVLPSQVSLFAILVAVTFALIFGFSVALFATMAELLVFLIIFSVVKRGAD